MREVRIDLSQEFPSDSLAPPASGQRTSSNNVPDGSSERIEDDLDLGVHGGLDRLGNARDALDHAGERRAIRDSAAGTLDGEVLEGDYTAWEKWVEKVQPMSSLISGRGAGQEQKKIKRRRTDRRDCAA